MKTVKEAMDHRREQYAGDRDEDQSAEKRVERGEEFCGGTVQFVHGPHAAEQHRGIQERVEPRQGGKVVIAEDPDAESYRKDQDRENGMTRESQKKNPARKKRFMAALEFHLDQARKSQRKQPRTTRQSVMFVSKKAQSVAPLRIQRV
jgi:hypothetical protein